MDNRGLASWEIVYTAPNQAYIDKGVNIPVKLDDTLQTGLDIVKDSIQVETKLKGQDQVQNDNSQIQTTDTGFTYAIADDVETIKIKYNTQLTDEEFAKALAGNNNTTYTNTVKVVDLNEAPVLTKNANVNTNAIKMIISKKAYDVTYHAAEGGNKAYYTLDWESTLMHMISSLQSLIYQIYLQVRLLLYLQRLWKQMKILKSLI